MNEEWVEARLDALRGEAESGRQILAETEERAADLRQTLLRISGAIQVLEEGLKAASESQNSEKPAIGDADATVSQIVSSG